MVAAASETEGAVTNGMSLYARDGGNINGGLLVGVTPADFGGTGPLAGIAFQRALERRAFLAGGGGFFAPVQRVEDFLARRASAGPGRVLPTYRPGVRWTNLWEVLPDFIAEALAQALASSVKGEQPAPVQEEAPARPRGFVCKICGFIYEGDTLPEDYTCPICRRPAADFEPVQ